MEVNSVSGVWMVQEGGGGAPLFHTIDSTKHLLQNPLRYGPCG